MLRTVGRFVEYAYSGEYTVPEPDIVQLPTDSRELEDTFKSTVVMAEPAKDDDWAMFGNGKKSKKVKKKLTASPWGAEFDVIEESILEPMEAGQSITIAISSTAEQQKR